MTVNSQLKEIKTQLRLSMNGSASASMREKGLKYKLNFGVELPRIKQIASQLDKDHDLAQALWKEDIRECKILAGLLQPIDTFFPEIMDIWIEAMPTVEIAEMTCMHLFQYLPYAPQKSLQLIANEGEYQQICGYLTIARLLTKKNDMTERAENELLDQAVVSFLGALANFILATCKDRSHRIPLKDGIYGETTLIYQDHDFQALPWTYADYRSDEIRAILRSFRDTYRKKLKEK